MTLFFCLFVNEVFWGTTERICAKFTGKTCLVPRLDEFECQGEGHQGQKMCCALPSPPAATEWNAFAA